MEEKGLTTEQIYNANKTGLLWKCLPDKALVSCCEKSAPGFKKSKDHLTILGCTNATGTHKLEPVMIGKFAKPRCFKNVNMDALPVIYKSQRDTWMNSKIFASGLRKILSRLLNATNVHKTFVRLKLCCWLTTVLLILKSWKPAMGPLPVCFSHQTQLRLFSRWIKASYKQWRTATRGNSFRNLFAIKILIQHKTLRKL